MSGAPWRYAFASTAGTAHTRRGLPCQDASLCQLVPAAEGPPILVALAADGAGSASRAEVGAELACAFFLDEITAFLAAGSALADLNREAVWGLLQKFQGRIGEEAAASGLTPRDFAATLVAAVVGVGEAVFFQVGDGAIVVSTPEERPEERPEEEAAYSWVFWPASGEYENTTFFLTDGDVERHLAWERSERPIDQLALFTDGLQRLALHFQSRTAHAPFFRSKLRVLENAADAAPETLSHLLAHFLSSPEVDARTDDDKTLILATRRPPASPLEPPEAPPTANTADATNAANAANAAKIGADGLR
jgi:hypothetical protein